MKYEFTEKNRVEDTNTEIERILLIIWIKINSIMIDSFYKDTNFFSDNLIIETNSLIRSITNPHNLNYVFSSTR